MKPKTFFLFLAMGFCLWMGGNLLFPQEILLDRGIKAGKLDCFPVYGDEKTFYYLPANPRLAEKDGKPQFSFMKYVQNVPKGGEGGTTRGEGGGLVHFLVVYGPTEEERAEAEQELQMQVPDARLAGPVIYRSGNFILEMAGKKENGELVKEIVGLGKAPIMEGHKAAVAMHLSQKGASLLWEAFRNPTSQISVTFEMTVKGYRNPYEATLEANWDKIRESHRLNVGMKYAWLGVDIDLLFQELRKTGAIKLHVKGESKSMDKIWQKALTILMDQMFQKDNSLDSLTDLRQGGGSFNNLNKATELLEKERKSKKKGGGGGTTSVPQKQEKDKKKAKGKADPKQKKQKQPPKKPDKPGKKGQEPPKKGAEKPEKKGGKSVEPPPQEETAPSFAIIASYQLRRIKKSGKALIHLNQWRQESLEFRFTENIGGLDKYFDNPKFFRAVNLDDPVYKQREVVVMLDGQDVGNFKNYVNYVTVQIRKEHDSGDMTHDELKIDRVNFNKNANNFTMIYGWKGDNNRSKWLSYKYKTRWSFHGGVFHEDQWKTTNDFVITVTPPHKYRKIILEADPEVFKEKKVRDASIKFYYNFYGKKMVKQATIRTSKKVFSKEIEYAHPEGAYDYEYEITWHLRGQKVLKTDRLKGSGDVIYCDELPEQNP